MGAALVEHALVSAIQSVLPDASGTAALFDRDNAPFNTFYRKIVVARAFSFFGEDVADDLNIIRDVRNQFAHALLKVDFTNEHIARQCEKIGPYEDWVQPKRRRSTNRLKYENACYSLAAQLLELSVKNLKAKLRLVKGGLLTSGFKGRVYEIRRDIPKDEA
jgi:hypothetical protein